jgi:DNA-binding transcriptional regulator YhcF (GntR family)
MEQTNKIKLGEYFMHTCEEYSHDLNIMITTHNLAINLFVEKLKVSSVVNLLVEKGIITKEEYTDTFNTILNSDNPEVKFDLQEIEYAKNVISELIEAEREFRMSMDSHVCDCAHDEVECSDDCCNNIFNTDDSTSSEN